MGRSAPSKSSHSTLAQSRSRKRRRNSRRPGTLCRSRAAAIPSLRSAPQARSSASPMSRPRAGRFWSGWRVRPCQESRRSGSRNRKGSGRSIRPLPIARRGGKIRDNKHTQEASMKLAELHKVAEAMVAPGRGILAADESTGTIKKRFDAIGVESTADSRRDYRELMFRTTDAMSKHISGVILYDETIRQNAKDGTPLVKVIEKAGSIPGIKVDKGVQPL